MSRRPKTAGLTLIEVVALIIIVAIFIALLLPAGSGAGEAARRNSCLSKIRQLSLALKNYESSQGTFPMAVNWFDRKPHALTDLNVPGGESTSPNAATDDGHSWIVVILPFIEEKDRYEECDFGKGPFHADNAMMANERIPVIECPSFSGNKGDVLMEGQTVAITQYAAMSATTLPRMLDGSSNFATGEAANGGLVAYTHLDNRQFVDGASKTIILCETREPVYAGWTSGVATSLFGMYDAGSGDVPTINIGGGQTDVMSADDWGG